MDAHKFVWNGVSCVEVTHGDNQATAVAAAEDAKAEAAKAAELETSRFNCVNKYSFRGTTK
jgi:hypothetical protein